MILSGELAVLQASMLDRLSFDTGPFGKETGGPAETDVGRRQIVEALMIAVMVVVVDEGLDPPPDLLADSSFRAECGS